MKKPLPLLAIFIALLFITCDRDWDNPFHDKNTLDPEAWAPENLQIETVSITERKLTWSYNGHPNIEGFKIDRKKGDEPWLAAFATLPKETRTWNDTTLIPLNGLTYQYRLYAFAGNNASAVKNATTNASIPAPTDLAISRNTITSVRLIWQDNSIGEEGFRIERKYEQGNWAEVALTNNTSWQDTIFELNKMIYYRVNAYYNQYNSAWTEKSFDATIPPPENLAITANSATSVTLNWSYNHTGHEGFKIDRKSGNEDWVIGFETLNPEQITFHDNDVNLSIQNFYRIYSFYGNYSSDKSEILATLQIGMAVHGGIVFYLDGNGGGLVCAESDQSAGARWGCSGTTIGGTGTGIGAGAANTAKIVAGCSEAGIAARICNDLVLNGYSDWFLPSKDELNLMYQNLKLAGIGGFADYYYWSSSELSSSIAWIQYFLSGNQGNYLKYYYRRVRAVRAF